MELKQFETPCAPRPRPVANKNNNTTKSYSYQQSSCARCRGSDCARNKKVHLFRTISMPANGWNATAQMRSHRQVREGQNNSGFCYYPIWPPGTPLMQTGRKRAADRTYRKPSACCSLKLTTLTAASPYASPDEHNCNEPAAPSFDATSKTVFSRCPEQSPKPLLMARFQTDI